MSGFFSFRIWPRDKTERLRELWWQGKSANDCCAILRAASPHAVRDKVKRAGFVRDPRLLKHVPDALLPQPRGDGDLVTMRNCKTGECQFPYGPPVADMVMCGRRVKAAPYCDGHRKIAYTGHKTAGAL